MTRNSLCRSLLFIIASLLPVAHCIAWTSSSSSSTTANAARATSTNAYRDGRSNIWGVLSTRGGSTDNDVTKTQRVQRFLVLMDVFCEFHGRYLTDMARDVYGVECIPVLSEYMADYFTSMEEQQQQQQKEDGNDGNGSNMPCMPSSPEEAVEWRQNLLESFLESEHANRNNYEAIELRGLICESDPGLADAERLSAWLNVTNHNGFNEARRNKFLTISTLAAKKIPTVRQQLCSTMEQAMGFATNEFTSFSANRVVVKPVRGCASDDVFLCDTLESVRSAYETIQGSTVLGSPTQKHESVLVQEYAIGQEYAIDTVTKNGKLKIAAVWKYDKRPQPPTIEQSQTLENLVTRKDESDGDGDGSGEVDGMRRQVYYATRLFDDDDEPGSGDSDFLLPAIYQYLEECLNALDIRWGVTHTELIITADGPRLIEVNCRQHNMNFVPITDNAIGYNLYDMLLAAYFGDDDDNDDPGHQLELITEAQMDWDLLPDYPSRRMNGAMVHLVNDKKGILKRLNEDALYEIQSMESVSDLEVFPEFLQPGVSVLEPTVDIKTDAGWIQMIHPDPEIFERDYKRIMELMPTLFEV
mmetsp:Transcript_14786/g.41211  ORF Transcript_14786/g.41211 Transcript_14786/m.41211 type:complete len:585 (-) Transcript_14786:2168-3922(-)